MKKLAVFLNERQVGVLSQDRSGLLEFQYDSVWLDDRRATPLSRTLPLQDTPFKGNEARVFFAGILPDEGIRHQVASILGISERNDFVMLEHIGGECAGAVSLLPMDTVPVPESGATRPLDRQELDRIVKLLLQRPLLAGESGVRLSLAGSQTKLPVIKQNDSFALPLGNTPSTHILKPEPERFPGLVDNEFFCMSLAKEIGLKVPAVSWLRIDMTPCLFVERYDRVTDSNGVVQRLHQEDFCQALGFPPERKYQQEGGPLLRDAVALLRDWSTLPAIDILDFLEGVIFNVVIGNADAHGKNYSLLYSNGERRLAPLYDLVSTIMWPELSIVPAMKIGQSSSINRITSTNWQKMANECRIGWPMLRNRINEICRKIKVVLEQGELIESSNDQKIAGYVSATIEERVSM
ncbi:MAG: type II toxin-antitoxin system HipA family toxin, partial [Lentisphaerae bacterium]|nr:type II toxin-antitoxin system HipA family toxin [Lentisphaerota bacterium]